MGETEPERHLENSKLSYFQRLEYSFLQKIRERRWATTLLSKYQSMRVVQQLQRNLAHVLMCDNVIEMLKKQDDLEVDAREQIVKIYKERKKHYRRHLKLLRGQFPRFYHHYLEQLAKRSMINKGWNQVVSEFEHDDLGAKGFVSIQRKVQEKMARYADLEPAISNDEDSVAVMLDELELFRELSTEDRSFVEKNAACITFLPGDNIMGAYEAGDSFYIIINGEAVVWRTDALSYAHRVANLSDGDIMGESSLLAELGRGRHARSATIKAETPCSVLRISMRSMLTILKKYPGIKNNIQQIHDARGADHAPGISDDY